MASLAEVERRKLLAQQEVEDLMSVMSTRPGRRFVARILFEFCGLEVLGYATDPSMHAFNTGQRAVGLHLDKAVFLAARGSWALMRAERIQTLHDLPVDAAPHKTDD
jgi:hypothetical protein